MKISTHLRVATAVVAACLALSACSGGTNDDTTSGATDPVTGAATSSAPAVDYTLHLSMQAPPSNLSIGNYSGGDTTIFLSVYDTILHKDLEAAIQPGLAEKWEYNADMTKLTLTIRQGIKFTNGEALDAQAVAASLKASCAGSSTAENLKSISSVDATDASTVVITLSKPDAALIPLLGGIHGAVGAPSLLSDESSQLKPIGSGAYILDEAGSTPGSVYLLKKNPDFYNADLYPFATVEERVIADNTAAQNAVKAGQLDYSGLPSMDLFSQFPAADFTTGNNRPGAIGILFLADREGKVVPALAHQEVRQAINLAFDRATIAAKLGPGIMNPTVQVVNPAGGAWGDDINATYNYNVDKAKSLLATAGFADGFAITMPSTVMSTQFEPIITQSLADIGITVTWESVPFQDFYTKVFGGNYGMYFMYNGFVGNDALDINAVMGGAFNPFYSSTPELQDLMDKANTSTSADAFKGVNKYLVDQAWFAPIVYMTPAYVISNNVTYTPPVITAASVLPWAPAK
ncbi:MAG: ABC transporter substrate-binding protein [Propionibacteriaceae bacterium]|jgi:peptide/nickel transport system substrate-binding protein|nr:ABC transporter substrate-binding protein [Propionibacteriaceae bacterium]